MNLRFVEAFHWAATLNSVTRAAEKLHITQSALSARIASLERELGVLLLDRRDKRFHLTLAGQRFRQHAQKLLDLQHQVKHELGSGPLGGRVLRLGVIESVVHSWLTDWLDHMRSIHADMELDLTVETTPVLVDQLQRGKLDLVFSVLPASGDGVRSLALPPMPMCFVGPARPRARRAPSTLAGMAASDLLTFQRGSQPHLALLQTLRRHGIEQARVHAISSISAMAQLVAIGFGIATLPRATVDRLSRQAPLRALPCDVELEALPIHASFRDDPSLHLIASGLASVPGFTPPRSPRRGRTLAVGAPARPRRADPSAAGTPTGARSSSRKSIKA